MAYQYISDAIPLVSPEMAIVNNPGAWIFFQGSLLTDYVPLGPDMLIVLKNPTAFAINLVVALAYGADFSWGTDVPCTIAPGAITIVSVPQTTDAYWAAQLDGLSIYDAASRDNYITCTVKGLYWYTPLFWTNSRGQREIL